MAKLMSGLVAGILLAAGAARGETDPGALAVPPGAALALAFAADGIQLYACEATAKGPEWVFKAPEAALFDSEGRQAGTHAAGPTWTLDDGSSVVGEVIGKADAAEPGAIPWLLLRARSHAGTGALGPIGFIRRVETHGGTAPATGCDAGHLAATVRMRYAARYEFYRAAP